MTYQDKYLSLEGKTALITGAGQGIGLAVAQLFLKYGASVALLDRSGKASLHADKLGNAAKGFTCDVRDENQVKNTVKEVINHFGKVDILVNNAGVIVRKDVINTTAEEWELSVDTGLKGIFLFSKYVLPDMISRKDGIIINTASNCAFRATPGAASYNTVKGAVVSLTRAMALDYASQNIRINCVCPGDILTPMLINEGIQTGKIKTGNPQTPEEQKAFAEFLSECGSNRPMGHIATAEQIAYTFLYLATDMSLYATGSSVVVDGGRIC